MVRPERLLGATRLAPSGPPCGRSTRPDGRVVELVLFVCREFEFRASNGERRLTVLSPFNHGAPGEIRTPGLLVRSQALYPTELRAQIEQLGRNTWRRGRDCSRPAGRSSRRFRSGPPSLMLRRHPSSTDTIPLPFKHRTNSELFEPIGGEGGIRTLDGLLTHTPLAGARLRPLGHLSGSGNEP